MGAITSHYNLAIIIQEQRRGNAVRDLKQDLTLVNQRLDKHGVAAGAAANKTEQFITKTRRLGQAIRKVLVPALLLAATAAVKFGTDSFKAFAQFDKGMQEVFTLLPERTQQLEDDLSNGIKAVGAQFGFLTEETIPALYQALSAGIPEDNAIVAVELAAQAAKAGASDLESTMRIGMAVVNAYGGEIYSLEEAYDLIFQLIDKGVPRMSDWANSLQDVISIASEARTPFEDIVAALAVMTRQGDSAAESAELLGFILMQMQIEGTTAAGVFMEATGVSYREWIATGNGLVEGLQRIDQYAIETGQHLDSMIGGSSNFYRDQQAARGTMELTGLHMQELIDLAALIGEETEGSMKKAYGVASDNAQQSLDELGAKWENIKLKIGEAIWTQDIFFGQTGEQMFQNVENFVDLASGTLGEQLITTLEGAVAEVKDKNMLLEIAQAWADEDRTVKIPLFPDWELFQEETAEGNTILRNELAKYYDTYEDFRSDMMKFGLAESFTPLSAFGGPMQRAAGDPMGRARRQAARDNAKIDADLRKEWTQSFQVEQQKEMNNIQELNILEGNRVKTLGVIDQMKRATGQLDLERIILEEQLFQMGEGQYVQEQNMSSLLLNTNEAFKAATESGEDYRLVVHWIAVETHAMSAEAEAYLRTVSTEASTLFNAYDTLAAASGEWVQVLSDNSGEITSIMDQLTSDLTDEEKSAMSNILTTAVEGGEEWLAAWRKLQTDLTQSQRNELIARVADLQAADGVYRGVWTGDTELAKASEEEIIAAMEAIEEAYYNMAHNIFLSQLEADTRMAGTTEAALAMVELKRATGEISDPEAEFLTAEITKSGKLKDIMDEMYVAYMDDTVLSREEADKLALAFDTVNQHADTLTTEGLKAMIDLQLSETEGYPYVGTLIRDDLVGGLKNTKKESDKLTEKPIIPTVELDTVVFDKEYKGLMDNIKTAQGPWPVTFTVEVDGTMPGQENPDKGEATGTGGMYRTVPGGYPNDSYFVGLTSGEKYAVLTPGQQRQQGHGSGIVDNSITNLTIINNSRAAAAYSRAYMETQYEKRLRRFAGD